MGAGLVKGEGFAVDASVMEADASRYHGKAQTDAVKRYAMTKSEAFLSEHERTHQYTLMRDTFVAGLLFVGTTAAVIAFAMSLYVVQHRFPLW